LSEAKPESLEKFGERTWARSQALQILFQAEAVGRRVADVLAGDYAISEGPLLDYAVEVATNAADHSDVIDHVLGLKTASNWSLDRLNGVDRNILRIALAEMLFEDEVDTPIAINEAVVLAKAFGSDDSGTFVNGVLGSVARDLDAGIDVVGLAEEALAEPVVPEYGDVELEEIEVELDPESETEPVEEDEAAEAAVENPEG
jgi:N utilization substance protein B